VPFDEGEVEKQLVAEVGLGTQEARLYLKILQEGELPASSKAPGLSRLVEKGMVILSGDNSRFIPVHPRLAIANHYRSWRELMIKEMNDKRMRVDKLILRLIPVYEETAEKRMASGRVGKEA
jgi:sugar-specific transcriptional regulator TrmB